MHITVTGKQIDVGDALRRRTQAALEDIADKYFGNALEAHVVFSREAHLIHCDLQVHVGRGILVQSEADANEAYVAFDLAAERIDKRLRRYKRRLRDHRAQEKEREREETLGRTYVLQPGEDETESPPAKEPSQPMVIAEMETPIPQLSVSEAVMRLDLADLPALMFRNSARGTLSVIYRRRDGNIGWIDPGLPRQGRRSASS
ncbi:MAG: ribosome hibernation-promoting factor, HPF/YfiA family [Stellaceae bacterium]